MAWTKSELISLIPVHFSTLIPKMLKFTLVISCWSLPIYLNKGSNIPGPYTVLFFIASDVTSITSHIPNWTLFSLWLHVFFLELFLLSSQVAYWAPTNLGVHLSVSYLFPFSLLDSQGKNTEVVWHFLLQWTIFCHISPQCPIRFGWPYMAWLIVSLS